MAAVKLCTTIRTRLTKVGNYVQRAYDNTPLSRRENYYDDELYIIALARQYIEMENVFVAANTLGVNTMAGFFRPANYAVDHDIGIAIPPRALRFIRHNYLGVDKRNIYKIIMDLVLKICTLYKQAAS